jgi:hypothetical protein
MKADAYPVRSAMRALALFLHESCLDRTRDNLPLRELMDSRNLSTFQESLDQMTRSLLDAYSREQHGQRVAARRRRCQRCQAH